MATVKTLIGNIKGPKGDTGEKGDTGAIGATGAKGQRGSRWSQGTAITGTSTTATIFSGTGISDALVNDYYLNTSTGNVYRCTVPGSANTAKWVYAGNIKGAKGATGPQGEKGETGATGPKGEKGEKGDTPTDGTNMTSTFTKASARTNIVSGEKLGVIFGKIMKWFADLTAPAFAQVISSYTDMMSNTVAGYMPDALAVKAGFDAVNSNLLAENGHYHGIMGYNKYSSKYYCLVPMPNYIIKNYNIACSEVNVGGVMKVTNVYVDVSKSALSVQLNDTISTDLSGLWASAKLTFTAK